MKKCFIIMPISTPDIFAEKYRGGKEHFKHILKHVFVPAVKKADMEPIIPIFEGGEVIQGEIIKYLETAELVLCDMSILNPNVFYELGIRTALNKPVSIVKDEFTDKVPFDTSIINYHEYKSEMNGWELENEIDKLSKHLKKCLAVEGNSMWKYFGISSTAKPYESTGDAKEMFDFLITKIDGISRDLKVDKIDFIEGVLRDKLSQFGIKDYIYHKNGIHLSVILKDDSMPEEIKVFLMSDMTKFGYQLLFNEIRGN